MRYKISRTNEEWQQLLTEDEFAVCRGKATERPFSGEYNDSKVDGTYHCRCCDQALFSSDSKFDSGSGWPSFTQSFSDDAVNEETDSTHGMSRTEILCSRCGSHLGHVFSDGPKPSGRRYCVNSLSLKLDKRS